MTKKITTEDLQKMVESDMKLQEKRPKPQNLEDVILYETVVELDVFQISPFEKNPRVHKNSEYEQIKDSIKARGLESKLYVTKRPGTQKYILAKGGTTRLSILQELATANKTRWGKVLCLEVPYNGESDLVTAHMVENLGRGEMCFWDVAHGVQLYREEIEKETGKKLGDAALVTAMKNVGLTVNRWQIEYGQFALAHLHELGPWQANLKEFHIRTTIKPQYAEFLALWEKNRKEPGDFQPLIDQAIRDCVCAHEAYSVDVLVEAMRTAVEGALGIKINTSSDPAQSPGASFNVKQVPQGNSSRYDPTLRDPRVNKSASQHQDLGLHGVEVLPRSEIKNLVPLERGTNRKSKPGTGPLSAEELNFVEAKSPSWIAEKVFQDALLRFTRLAGIEHLITKSRSPLLPYGFYLEVPSTSLGGAQDYAAQAWWIVSSLLEQHREDIILADQMARQSGSPNLVFEQVAGGVAEALSSAELESEIINERLGGHLDPFGVITYVLRYENHSLHKSLLSLLQTMGDLDIEKGEGKA